MSKRVSGYFAWNLPMAGARCRTPKVIEQVSLSVPRGRALLIEASASASSRSLNNCTLRSKNASPLSVSDKRRVVRFSRRASRWASSWATSRDTAEVDSSSRSAARAKLPCSTTLVKTRIAASVSIGSYCCDYRDNLLIICAFIPIKASLMIQLVNNLC